MQTPLNASASTAGALLSSSTFEVPQFQREYSWQEDEIAEFWNDLSGSLESDSYFLGLVILTDEGKRKQVVDGQQRLITLSLLANAIYFEAFAGGRKALADRIQADFLRSIDYESDKTDPRLFLTDKIDNSTYQDILRSGFLPHNKDDDESVSSRLAWSSRYLAGKLKDDLRDDPFKRLGKWTDFLTNRVYFAVFVHPDPASAYQVYEVINTRGKELTTADLLKNYVLSQTAPLMRQNRYSQWQGISHQFPPDATNAFVQFIRHVVTVQSGHILPKDLFAFLARRSISVEKIPPTADELIKMLESYLPLYLQMVDPNAPGPADLEALKIFLALNSLGVIAVRPILLAVANVPDSLNGMKYILRLVVRRIVVGNLGTGNVERRFGEAAKRVYSDRSWEGLTTSLKDLNPTKDEFVEQLRRRSFSKGVLAFLRRSILERTITPNAEGVLHFISAKEGQQWPGMSVEEGAFWGSTIGNTFLSRPDPRPKEATDWTGFKENMLRLAVSNEWLSRLEIESEWNAASVEQLGKELAQVAGDIWYS